MYGLGDAVNLPILTVADGLGSRTGTEGACGGSIGGGPEWLLAYPEPIVSKITRIGLIRARHKLKVLFKRRSCLKNKFFGIKNPAAGPVYANRLRSVVLK